MRFRRMYVESVQNVFQHIVFSITGKQTKFTRISNGACIIRVKMQTYKSNRDYHKIVRY